ncbi:pore-forming ESAT-6 family protein [Paenibacillus sinopodophylli]|uniref:pore-forming ESAT-6 family protein n=1 Tax=Paenibacillus sinopodophylli TaxID=1837342 RepID=UPI00110CCC75|nr:pore-forming ESAT-6 family protein [Paenibacillus sinopodophylli]
MAIEGINISLGEVTKTAASLRRINKSLTERLGEIKKEMDGLAASWQSDASTTIRNNFNSFAPRFEEYRAVVESYAAFLDGAVSDYDAAETAINNNASAFK